MHFEQNLIYHIYNQGNNKEPIFFQERNYLYFLRKMRKHLLPHVNFLCYCLMPNHFHFLVVVVNPSIQLKDNKTRRLNESIGLMLRSYTRAINRQEQRVGALFRPRTKAKNGWIDEFITVGSKHEHLLFKPDNDYARTCFQYIHNNPVEAGLVTKSEKWQYSSASDYAGLRNGTLCNQVLAKELLF